MVVAKWQNSAAAADKQIPNKLAVCVRDGLKLVVMQCT